MYLLDTNICINFALKRTGSLTERIRSRYNQGLGLSTITLAELRVGTRHAEADPGDERRLDEVVALLTLHSFDEAAADEYGRLARQVAFRRTSFDRLIAAHARCLGAILVTANMRDFADVPGLQVENWLTAA